MTKDWDVVQDEITELSFNQKKPLEEVKALMERKHKFRASTRAYRMKLKEWGLMRHKPRRHTTGAIDRAERSQSERDGTSPRDRESSATVEPMSIETSPAAAAAECAVYQATAPEGTEVLPTFMSLLGQPRDFRPAFDPWSEARSRASEIVFDMLGAILDEDSVRLEKLVVQNVQHVNDPIGQPFDSPTSRFFGHPALNKMVILQHPDQTILDIASGMPCGPVVWILLSHGAKGSRHPLGSDLALHNAIKNGRPYTVQALLMPGRSNVNGVTGSNWQPLRQAVFWNVPDVVRVLLNRGAKIEDSGPSPLSVDADHTALQLCLESRAKKYKDLPAKERCHSILKLLLDAGANINVQPWKGSTETVFQMFIRPWQNDSFWSSRPTPTELECFQILLSKSIDFHVPFNGFPCGSTSSKTFEHQILWHSTPAMSRFLIDNFVPTLKNDGSVLLHEILGSCPDAKRHPADTLRDIEILIQKGVSPNRPDEMGNPPLKKCIQFCPAVDIVARIEALLKGGADLDFPDQFGDAPWMIAARSFEEPLRSEVMQLIVANFKNRGRYDVELDINFIWDEGRFPIPAIQTYEQVMASTRDTGDFILNMRDIVPQDIQPVFQRAYISVVSKNFLDTMTTVVKSKMLTEKEKNEIVWIVSLRKGIDLPEYRFDQELVMALLDPQTFPSMLIDPRIPEKDKQSAPPSTGIVANTISPPSAGFALTASASAPDTSTTVHAPFQFNPNSVLSPSPPPTPTNPPTQPTAQEEGAKANEAEPQAEADTSLEDFFIPATTKVRWANPGEAAAPTPEDFAKGLDQIVKYKCVTCANGVLLTRKELERHETEHKHARGCVDGSCKRRFCGGGMKGRRMGKDGGSLGRARGLSNVERVIE